MPGVRWAWAALALALTPSGPVCAVAAPPTLGSRTAPPVLRAARRASSIVSSAPGLAAFSPQVLETSLVAVSELIASAGVGYAVVASGLVEPDAITQLARIVYNVLLPCFLFSNVVKTVSTIGLGGGMLMLPLCAMVQISVGLGVSALVLRVLRVPRSSASARIFTALSSFGNSAVLPLGFCEGLFNPAHYADPTVLPAAASYMALYLLGWSPVAWSIAPGVLAGERPAGPAGAPRWRRALAPLLQPPIVAALSGLLLGLCCPRALLEARRSPVQIALAACARLGRGYTPAAMLVLAGSLVSGASARVSAGADASALARAEPEPAPEAQERELGPRAMLGGVMASRFALSPLLQLTIIWALRALRLLPSTAQNPVLEFTLLLCASMPPAQNLVVIAQVTGDKRLATRLSRLLFVLYVVSSVPITLIIGLLLQRTGL